MPCRILVYSSKAKSPGRQDMGQKAFVFALTPPRQGCPLTPGQSYAINIEKLSTTQNLATQLEGGYPAAGMSELNEDDGTDESEHVTNVLSVQGFTNLAKHFLNVIN